MSFKFNAITGLLDLVTPGINTSQTTNIPQYDTDPVVPATQSAWVLKGGGASVTGGGTLQWFHGLSLAVTTTGTAGGGALTYQFSYRTLENTTKRVTIS